METTSSLPAGSATGGSAKGALWLRTDDTKSEHLAKVRAYWTTPVHELGLHLHKADFVEAATANRTTPVKQPRPPAPATGRQTNVEAKRSRRRTPRCVQVVIAIFVCYERTFFWQHPISLLGFLMCAFPLGRKVYDTLFSKPDKAVHDPDSDSQLGFSSDEEDEKPSPKQQQSSTDAVNVAEYQEWHAEEWTLLPSSPTSPTSPTSPKALNFGDDEGDEYEDTPKKKQSSTLNGRMYKEWSRRASTPKALKAGRCLQDSDTCEDDAASSSAGEYEDKYDPAQAYTETRRRTSREEATREVVFHRGLSSVEAIMKGFMQRFDCWMNAGRQVSEEEIEHDLDERNAGDELDLTHIRLMKPAEFNSFLKYYGVDLDAFGSNYSRSLKDLWLEVVWQTTNLMKYPDESSDCGFRIRRLVCLMVIELQATINGETRFLTLQSEGKRKDLNQRLVLKMFCDEENYEAVGRCMLQNFEIPEAATWKNLSISETLFHQEERESKAYPGLTTIYDMFTARMQVVDINAPSVRNLGLPNGDSFKTQKSGGVGLPQTRVWAWENAEVFDKNKKCTSGKVVEGKTQVEPWSMEGSRRKDTDVVDGRWSSEGSDC